MFYKRLAFATLTTVLLHHATVIAQTLPTDIRSNSPTLALSGESKLTFFGLEIYKASLWRNANFVAENYAQHEFALDLNYLRNFQGKDIAKRSIEEMRRQSKFDEALLQNWEIQMQKVFPNVQAGDNITGFHLPGKGAKFWHNGKWRGDINDAEFAKYFFGIWLSKQTSEPKMRLALLEPKFSPERVLSERK
ncbi:MAG TPA: chalcone isomerase family protein [Burkholderiaceae bacterium]|nr:chalcone isomerase family protein [Burkholderiaceae bacterium]